MQSCCSSRPVHHIDIQYVKEFEQPDETAPSIFDGNDEWEIVCTTENSHESNLSVSMTLDELKSQGTARLLELSAEKFTNSISDITFLVPTPKCIYPPDHKNAKFKLLNTLNVNVMDRSAGAAGLHSRAQMETLIREIVQFNKQNNEPTQYESYGGGNKYRLVRIPVSKNEKEFKKKAKYHNWIEEVLQSCLESGDMGDALKYMLQYMKTRHSNMTRDQMRELGLTPKQMSEYEMSATMKAADVGITSWRQIVKCFVTFCEIERESLTMSEHA